MSYLKKHSKTVGIPPQSMPLDERQVPNSAGGYAYEVDKWKQLERFLILGTEGGSYYAGEQKLTFENIASLDACLKEDGDKTVRTILQISDEGRAPKNDPALFALAYAISHGDQHTRQYAADVLASVARTGTHLFHFAEYAQNMRGWGNTLKHPIAAWYREMEEGRLADQVIKYRQRDGWTHRDLLRLSHPVLGDDTPKSAIARWVIKDEVSKQLPSRILAHIELQKAKDGKTAAKLIRDFRLPWESVPTELLKEPVVWEALLEHMPITAMIRNLGRMSSIGLLKPLSAQSKLVSAALTQEALLKKGRVHPLQLLIAMRTYAQGRGDKGSLTWTAVPQITTALEEGYYLAFKTIEPSGKNFYLALDVSGSMTSRMSSLPITCHEGTACMAMVTARKEPNYYVRGFTTGLVDLGITSKMTLEEAMRRTHNSHFGDTDCALPMLDAIEQKLDVDVFCVYTDNETWAGHVHPKQALDQYRQKMGKNAKLVVIGMVANSFSIADPKDAGMLDVVGFDTATPQLISGFARE